MAIAFNNFMATASAGVPVDVMSVPTDFTATVFGLTVANTSSNPGKVSIQVGPAGSQKYLIMNAPIEVGGTLVAVGGSQKVVVMANQKVTVTVTGAATADVICSAMVQ